MASQALWLRLGRHGINRWLAWLHRWAGVVLCLLFVLWFASGAVLHFIGFPALPEQDRIVGSEPIELARLEIDPVAALSKAPDADELRLVSVAGRPVYLGSSAVAVTAVAGDTGEVLGQLAPAAARSVAERFGAHPSLRVDGPIHYDQWVVHHRFDPYRPFYRVRLDDERHTDLYVSARTGEVLQRTRADERAWNWCGAVMHWIYFTPLRKNWSTWDQVVWWGSLAAVLTSAIGFWLGVLRFAAYRAAGRPGLSPYRGWMKWHHVIGLFAGIIVLTWIFSGWLSMDHGRLFSRSVPSSEQTARMRGMPTAAVASATTLDALKAAGPATVISFNAVASRPFLVIQSGASIAAARIKWLDTSELPDAPLIPEGLLLAGAKAVWPGAVPVSAGGGSDVMYRLSEGVSPEALAVEVDDHGTMLVYMDRLSGRLLVVMDPSRRAYAWTYYALHTFNFPLLTAYPAVRTATILLLLTCGLAFSVTAVVIGIVRVKRALP